MSTENPMSLSASSSLRALVEKWRERAAREHQQGNERDHARDSQSYLYGCEHAREDCARELSAALDAHQEEENQRLRACQSENACGPEATPKVTMQTRQLKPGEKASSWAERFRAMPHDDRLMTIVEDGSTLDALIIEAIQSRGRRGCDICGCGCTGPASSPPERSEGWQPIETAPKDGTSVLCYVPNRRGFFSRQDVAVVAWIENGWQSVNSGHWIYSEVTHWMPLPLEPSNG
jgi:hypothetical protein